MMKKYESSPRNELVSINYSDKIIANRNNNNNEPKSERLSKSIVIQPSLSMTMVRHMQHPRFNNNQVTTPSRVRPSSTQHHQQQQSQQVAQQQQTPLQQQFSQIMIPPQRRMLYSQPYLSPVVYRKNLLNYNMGQNRSGQSTGGGIGGINYPCQGGGDSQSIYQGPAYQSYFQAPDRTAHQPLSNHSLLNFSIGNNECMADFGSFKILNVS